MDLSNIKQYWIIIALFGAIIYGSFSLLLTFLNDKLKKNHKLIFGYGLFVDLWRIIPYFFLLCTILFIKPEIYNIVKDNMDFKILLLVAFISAFITPIHALVVNKAGTVGQETMYTLAIIPVMIGGYFVLNERLSLYQLLGIILGGVGTIFMSMKN